MNVTSPISVPSTGVNPASAEQTTQINSAVNAANADTSNVATNALNDLAQQVKNTPPNSPKITAPAPAAVAPNSPSAAAPAPAAVSPSSPSAAAPAPAAVAPNSPSSAAPAPAAVAPSSPSAAAPAPAAVAPNSPSSAAPAPAAVAPNSPSSAAPAPAAVAPNSPSAAAPAPAAVAPSSPSAAALDAVSQIEALIRSQLEQGNAVIDGSIKNIAGVLKDGFQLHDLKTIGHEVPILAHEFYTLYQSVESDCTEATSLTLAQKIEIFAKMAVDAIDEVVADLQADNISVNQKDVDKLKAIVPKAFKTAIKFINVFHKIK